MTTILIGVCAVLIAVAETLYFARFAVFTAGFSPPNYIVAVLFLFLAATPLITLILAYSRTADQGYTGWARAETVFARLLVADAVAGVGVLLFVGGSILNPPAMLLT